MARELLSFIDYLSFNCGQVRWKVTVEEFRAYNWGIPHIFHSFHSFIFLYNSVFRSRINSHTGKTDIKILWCKCLFFEQLFPFRTCWNFIAMELLENNIIFTWNLSRKDLFCGQPGKIMAPKIWYFINLQSSLSNKI